MLVCGGVCVLNVGPAHVCVCVCVCVSVSNLCQVLDTILHFCCVVYMVTLHQSPKYTLHQSGQIQGYPACMQFPTSSAIQCLPRVGLITSWGELHCKLFKR